MRFRTKMIMTYAGFVLLAAFVLGVIYNNYAVREYKQKEYSDVQFLSDRLANQFDETVKSMKSITDYILSDANMLSSIRILGSAAREKGVYTEEALSVIQSGINTDYIMKNFYRVIVFNERGDAVASYNYAERVANTNVQAGDIPWLEQVKGKKGKPVLVGKHVDDWGIKNHPEVYSVVREIMGTHMGYIEVQREVLKLDDLFALPESDIGVAAIKSNGEILYSSMEKNQTAFYSTLVAKELKQVDEYKNQVTGRQELISVGNSIESDVRIFVVEDMQRIVNEAGNITPLTFLVAGCFFLISMIFVIIASGHLTKPIQKLKEQMENTGIENLDKEVRLDTTNNEVEALSYSYQNVLNRLHASMITEKRMSLLQLQAQFDTLQAQVNPHFLYNVLNVIANKGINNGDEEICEICGCLASMLRYATSTVERYASVRQELDYLRQYFYLIKSRYEHKLEFDIQVDVGIEEEIIPKIVLQQIVENCINHGYTTSSQIMKITVRGFRDEKGWYIEVRDNGEGIAEEVLVNLGKQIAKIHVRLGNQRSNVEMEIGGMGLINTYARLYLLYSEKLIFHLENGETGAIVTVGARYGEVKGEQIDV